jgi:hypothetical protein
MEELSKKEILDELERLGIDSASERNSYLFEYKEYSKSADSVDGDSGADGKSSPPH